MAHDEFQHLIKIEEMRALLGAYMVNLPSEHAGVVALVYPYLDHK